MQRACGKSTKAPLQAQRHPPRRTLVEEAELEAVWGHAVGGGERGLGCRLKPTCIASRISRRGVKGERKAAAAPSSPTQRPLLHSRA